MGSPQQTKCIDFGATGYECVCADGFASQPQPSGPPKCVASTATSTAAPTNAQVSTSATSATAPTTAGASVDQTSSAEINVASMSVALVALTTAVVRLLF